MTREEAIQRKNQINKEFNRQPGCKKVAVTCRIGDQWDVKVKRSSFKRGLRGIREYRGKYDAMNRRLPGHFGG